MQLLCSWHQSLCNKTKPMKVSQAQAGKHGCVYTHKCANMPCAGADAPAQHYAARHTNTLCVCVFSY
eukprot:1160405-Pelagomonas_calceolata.AAC.4